MQEEKRLVKIIIKITVQENSIFKKDTLVNKRNIKQENIWMLLLESQRITPSAFTNTIHIQITHMRDRFVKTWRLSQGHPNISLCLGSSSQSVLK